VDQRLHEIPFVLLAAGIVAGLVGGGLLVWLLWHAGRGLVDRPRVPRSRATYGFYTLLCLVLLAGASVTLGLGRLLRDHARLDGKTPVAEVRCERTSAGKVRITYSETKSSTSSAPAPIEASGPSCELTADLVTMRSLLGRLGMGTLVRVTRVGREPRPPQNPAWLVPDAAVPAGLPLALVVRDSRVTTVTVQPDDKAVFHLVATPDGLALEKSTGLAKSTSMTGG
jgi:hypothetical protein